MEETLAMPSCPMAKACKGMMEKPSYKFWMIIPGVFFIILGVVIIAYPQVLTWLVAVTLVVMGVAMLMMVNFMRSVGKRS